MQLKRIGAAFDRIYRMEQNSNLEKIEQANSTLENKMDALLSGKIDDVALQTDIEQKLNDLEAEYAPKLTEVSAKLVDSNKEKIFVEDYKIQLPEVDDTERIRRAIMDSEGKHLVFNNPNGYIISDTVNIPSNISVSMFYTVTLNSDADIPGFIIGSVETRNQNAFLKINVKRNTVSDWTSENCIGVKLINAYESEIIIDRAANFTIGAQMYGDTKGFVYNNIFLYSLDNNKYGIDLNSDNGGWTNENVFYGGRFSTSTSRNSGVSRFGIRITSKDGYIQNNNTFIKPSFELKLSTALPSVAIPILIESGSQNTFEYCRSEGNSDTFARILGSSTENSFQIGYGSINTTIEDNSLSPASDLKMNRKLTTEQHGVQLVSYSNIQKKVCLYNGTNSFNVAGMFCTSSTTSIADAKSITNLVITDDYLELGAARGIGVIVDTRKLKRFLIRRDVVSANPGRIAIRCYDSDGNVLTNSGVNHPYVKSMNYTNFSFETTFGGSYRTTIDRDSDYYIYIHQDVAKIAIIFTVGSSPLRIRGFSISSLDGGHTSISPGYEEIAPGFNIATTPPTTGAWAIGKKIYNDNPTPGSYEGWINTASGWKGFGVIQA